MATANYGREDVDSGLTHYFFDGATGELIDENENGIPDVAEDTPPEPYPQDPYSQAGIDFQLSLTEYDSGPNLGAESGAESGDIILVIDILRRL